MTANKYTTRRAWLESTIERFWQNVDRSGDCWIWTGTKGSCTKQSPLQYGGFGITDYGKSVSYRAHRFAWLLVNGPIPEGKILMHTCDVPLCVNPSHLRIAEPRHNSRDMVRKGRSKTGSRHWNSKLTEDDVVYIRTSGKTVTELSREFDIHTAGVSRIMRGETWTHVPMPDEDSVLQQHKESK